MGFGQTTNLFTEDFRFNMGAMYMSIISDVIKHSVISSINKDFEQFSIATRELLDICYPILYSKRVVTKGWYESLDEVDRDVARLKEITQMKLKEKKSNDTILKLKEVRSQVLKEMRSFLMPIERSFTPEGKLKDALGVGVPKDDK